MAHRLALALSVLLGCRLLGACSGAPQPGETGHSSGGTGPEPGGTAGSVSGSAGATDISQGGSIDEEEFGAGGESGGEIVRTCGFETQSGPDEPVRWYLCTELGDAWSCECDAVTTVATGTDCTVALLNACGVGVPERNHCRDSDSGCWPIDADGQPSTAAGDAWSCRCGADEALVPVTAELCDDALFRQCAETCDTDDGTCVPTETAHEYSCLCSYYGGPDRRFWSQESCASAVYAACNPLGHGGAGCNSFAGYCDQTDTGFACQCIDGESYSVLYASLPSDDCQLALDLSCGLVEPPADLVCSDERIEESTTRSGECTRQDVGSYSCECRYSSPQSTGASGNLVDAATCVEALESCFQ